MRITLVMASAEDGGLEKHVIELANGLSREHDVTLIAHARFAQQLQPKVQHVVMDLSGSRHNPWTKYQLKKKILATSAQVVHVHAAKTAQLVQGMLASLSCPSIVTVHGQKKNNQVNEKFDRIIVVSQQLKQQLSQQDKVEVVYNGVALQTAVTPMQKNRKFIAVGRLNEVKGFDILLRAWQHIPHQLNIAGEGEQREALAQLIEQLQLSDRVQLLGFREDIQALISTHEALIVSSLREGGPYTLAEALLLQRPVIGTQVGMMAEFLAPEHLCASNDAQALQQLISSYCQLEQPAQVFAPTFAQATAQLSLDSMLQHTQAVYQQAIAARAP